MVILMKTKAIIFRLLCMSFSSLFLLLGIANVGLTAAGLFRPDGSSSVNLSFICLPLGTLFFLFSCLSTLFLYAEKAESFPCDRPKRSQLVFLIAVAFLSGSMSTAQVYLLCEHFYGCEYYVVKSYGYLGVGFTALFFALALFAISIAKIVSFYRSAPLLGESESKGKESDPS